MFRGRMDRLAWRTTPRASVAQWEELVRFADAGHFLAITDPGSSLEALAREGVRLAERACDVIGSASS